jgi:hypothetical protein
MTQAMAEFEDNGKKRVAEGASKKVCERRRKSVIRAVNRGIGRIMSLRAHLLDEKERALEGKQARVWRTDNDGNAELDETRKTTEPEAGKKRRRKGKPRKGRKGERVEVKRETTNQKEQDGQWMETLQRVNTRNLEGWLEAGTSDDGEGTRVRGNNTCRGEQRGRVATAKV